jgi:hypothetical protein
MGSASTAAKSPMNSEATPPTTVPAGWQDHGRRPGQQRSRATRTSITTTMPQSRLFLIPAGGRRSRGPGTGPRRYSLGGWRPPPARNRPGGVPGQRASDVCTAPGCTRPAVRCDPDHTTAYDKGGRTCECNLAPQCKRLRYHRSKQEEQGDRE